MKKLNFKTEVYSFYCNRRTLVVVRFLIFHKKTKTFLLIKHKKKKVLKDHLYVFDAITMEKLFGHQVCSLPDPLSFAVALGSRWLAFPTIKPAPSVTVSQTGTEKMLNLAKGFASGLYSLGDIYIRENVFEVS